MKVWDQIQFTSDRINIKVSLPLDSEVITGFKEEPQVPEVAHMDLEEGMDQIEGLLIHINSNKGQGYKEEDLQLKESLEAWILPLPEVVMNF